MGVFIAFEFSEFSKKPLNFLFEFSEFSEKIKVAPVFLENSENSNISENSNLKKSPNPQESQKIQT